MGLDAIVGAFRQLELDPEGLKYHRDMFARLSITVREAGLPPYVEPEDLPEENTWSARIGSYGMLHHLRRLAAYIDAGRPLPEPIDDRASSDLVLKARHEGVNPSPSVWARIFGKNKPPRSIFPHLIDHSDAEGYYLPIDFPEPLVPTGKLEVPGGFVGSSVRLLDECQRLAALLELPPDADPESSEFDEPTESGPLWQRHAIASYVCLQLIAGARASVNARAAMVFC
jgi:hypothetical protein